MRWREKILALGWIVVLPACGELKGPFEKHTDQDTIANPDPGPCPGICVDTPPATFTGPSVFSIAPEQLVQGCPSDAPRRGVQGIVTWPYPMWFARECRITLTDACGSEGLTCVPLPTEDFQVCIHHDGDRSCPAEYSEYSEHTIMVDENGDVPITLCCMPRVAKG